MLDKSLSRQRDPASVRVLFGSRLRALRSAGGYATARAFARRLGIEENRYTRYERGEVEPDLGLIAQICEQLQVTAAELLPVGANDTLPSVRGFSEAAPVMMTATPDKHDHRRQLAWRLAERLSSIESHAGEGNATTDHFAELRRTAAIFAAIDRDPFAFAARVTADTRIADLPPTDRDGIAALLAQLLR